MGEAVREAHRGEAWQIGVAVAPARYVVTPREHRRVGDAEARARTMTICHQILKRDDLIVAARRVLKEGSLVRAHLCLF